MGLAPVKLQHGGARQIARHQQERNIAAEGGPIVSGFDHQHIKVRLLQLPADDGNIFQAPDDSTSVRLLITVPAPDTRYDLAAQRIQRSYQQLSVFCNWSPYIRVR